MTDTPMTETDVTEAAVDLLVEYRIHGSVAEKYADCACGQVVYRDDWRTHAETCPELRQEVRDRANG